MTEVFWLVSHGEDDWSADASVCLQLVEWRSTWREAKGRRANLVADGRHVEVFDCDGEMLWSPDGASGPGGCPVLMEAPKKAGLYRWSEGAGFEWLELPPMLGWRRTPGAVNEQRGGAPVR